ncbi:MAG TPA: ABC transporter ATP-binding protein, partial [Terriglobales bacterium]|nr:ABC transporter ATP-binding protein [Terriglobales bacterium]
MHTLSTEEVCKSYRGRRVVNGVCLNIEQGEVVGLLGPNGAGKTTTLRSISGIIPPTMGSVRIAGYDLLNDPINAKKSLAFFPDEPRLFDYLTVRQHLAFVARVYGVEHHEAIAQPLLEEF